MPRRAYVMESVGGGLYEFIDGDPRRHECPSCRLPAGARHEVNPKQHREGEVKMTRERMVRLSRAKKGAAA